MADVHANGVRFHVQRLPSRQGPDTTIHGSVVFIHGLIMDDLSSFFYTLANPAARAGADAILYDMRGHGRSERPPTGYSLADSAADLRALLSELDITGPVHLVGNSFGGTVAIEFALRHPELVAGMTLIEAHVPLAGWGERMRETFDDVTRSLGDPAVRARIDAENSRSLSRLAGRAEDLIERTTLPSDLIATPPMSPETLRGVECPVLALYGEHSDVAEYGAALADALPRCAYHVVPDHDHSLLMNGARDVLSLLMSWLAEHAPAASLPHQRRGTTPCTTPGTAQRSFVLADTR